MNFVLAIETSEDVRDIDFILLHLRSPMKETLKNKDYSLKEYWFNLRVFSKRFQKFFDDECKINKRSKRFIYSYEIDSTYFNSLSEQEVLELMCREIKKSLDKYLEMKPKTYDANDGFVDDVLSVINKWL